MTSISDWEMHAGKTKPRQRKRASIPDNWLCISDWQFTHQLFYGQRGKKERGMWQVHTFHCSWKNTKHCDSMLDVREGQCLYWNKNRRSHNSPHQNTYTHIHTGCTQRIIVCGSSSFDFSQSLRGKEETPLTRLHALLYVESPLFSANYSSLSHYWPLFHSCWVKRGWAYLGFGKAEWMLPCLSSREAVHHLLGF